MEDLTGRLSIWTPELCLNKQTASTSPLPNTLVVLALVCLFGRCEVVYGGSALKGVSYDGRPLIVNGKRELLFSGSIHYPRSIPEMWPDIIVKPDMENVIHTYAFWNLHEPVQGQINTCNGRNCGDTFTGPNRPNKRSLQSIWRPPISKGKILHSLLFDSSLRMYYGGINFGRTTSSFATTYYYDEAPLDEHGLPRETKWGHLRDLHAALRLSKKALLGGVTSAQKLGEDLEVKCIMPAGPNLRKASIELARTSLPFRKDILRVPQVSNLGHVMHAFVNGEYVDSGSYVEHRLAGVHNVAIQGLNTRTIDLSKNGWGHKVGLNGDKLHLFTQPA